MPGADLHLPQIRSFGETKRTDLWWVQPAVVFFVFASFIVYSTWAAFQGEHYEYQGGGAQYLSPMYSPEIFGNSIHALFGAKPGWWPEFLVYSPAFLILWAPGIFRFTCYYYRGAYYKAFWADPPNCAVGEPKARGTRYRGEAKWPLLIQNIHRYTLYLAIIFIFFLSYDAIISYRFLGEDGQRHLGIGVGSLVLTLNAVLLGAYTFSCHSFRHLVGGMIDRLSGHPIRKKAYDCVTCLNKRHMVYAWMSLLWVGFSDIYVRLCSMGIWSDWRIL